jgi:glutamyl-tRNA synthetase
MTKVRTRFAPSPTGYLHIGGLRTALYDYLLAKKLNGTFVLRIEDTDQARTVEGAAQNLIDILRWSGIEVDEGPTSGGKFGPYTQSERLSLYKEHAQKLVDGGHAYHCFCSSERLEQVRQRQIASKLPPAYDKHCRNLTADVVQQKLAANEPHVIRMKVPDEGVVEFVDLVHGHLKIACKVVDDQVLIKSDGFPTYHLAVVVDDHYMQISHVIRGEEWLPSTPKHVLLYKYFGWELPHFIHIPLILNTDKSKLSKRQGDVAVEDYIQKGYLPEALINFVAFMGWNPGDTREIFTMDELIRDFSIERIHKSGAIFNIDKLNWLNHQHLIRKTDDELLALVKPLFLKNNYTKFSDAYLKQVITLIKERVVVLPDFITYSDFFFNAPTVFDEKVKAKCWNNESITLIQKFTSQLESLANFDAAAIEQTLRTTATSANLNATKIIQPLRLVLTGVGQGPSLFHLIEVLGKVEVLKRITYALKTIN